jgi:hypothetical protein
VSRLSCNIIGSDQGGGVSVRDVLVASKGEEFR